MSDILREGYKLHPAVYESGRILVGMWRWWCYRFRVGTRNRGGNGQANSNIVVGRRTRWWRRWSVDEYLVTSHGGVVETQRASTSQENKGLMCVCLSVVSVVPYRVLGPTDENTGIGREQWIGVCGCGRRREGVLL